MKLTHYGLKVNPSNAWAITSGVVIMPWSVRSTRNEAIKSIEQNWSRPWSELRKAGNSVVRIRMMPKTRPSRAADGKRDQRKE